MLISSKFVEMWLGLNQEQDKEERFLAMSPSLRDRRNYALDLDRSLNATLQEVSRKTREQFDTSLLALPEALILMSKADEIGLRLSQAVNAEMRRVTAICDSMPRWDSWPIVTFFRRSQGKLFSPYLTFLQEEAKNITTMTQFATTIHSNIKVLERYLVWYPDQIVSLLCARLGNNF